MYIQRDLEKYITDFFQSTNKIQIVYGARQVGKTSMLEKVISKLGVSSLSLSGEKPSQWEMLQINNDKNYKILFSGYDLLYIDEAQYIPQIGKILKIIYDSLDIKVIVTGSSSFEIANKTSEPLTGRKITYLLLPLSINEIARYYTNFEIITKLDTILNFGLYPEIFLTENIHLKQKLLLELTDSYLFKDIFALSTIKNPEKLRKLAMLLALQIGNEVSVYDLANELSLSSETVNNYIDLLEKNFIIFRLQPYYKNTRKQLKKKFKVFFYDIGIRNALINDFRPFEMRQDKGFIWENFVISEIIKISNNNLKNNKFYFFRTYSGAEVDLIITTQTSEIYSYEIKLKKSKRFPPKSWTALEPEAKFETINIDNFLAVFEKISAFVF